MENTVIVNVEYPFFLVHTRHPPSPGRDNFLVDVESPSCAKLLCGHIRIWFLQPKVVVMPVDAVVPVVMATAVSLPIVAVGPVIAVVVRQAI